MSPIWESRLYRNKAPSTIPQSSSLSKGIDMGSAFHKTLLVLLLLTSAFSAQSAQIQYVHRITPSADSNSAVLERRAATGGNWETFATLPSRFTENIQRTSGYGNAPRGWRLDWAAQDPGSGAFCLGYDVEGNEISSFWAGTPVHEQFSGCTFDAGDAWHWFNWKGANFQLLGHVLKIRQQQGNIIISTAGGKYVAGIDTSGTTPPYTLRVEQTQGCGSDCPQLLAGLTGLSRVWYDPSQPGQGLTYTARPSSDGREGSEYWTYFTAYDTDGSTTWWLGPWGLVSYNGPAIQDSWNIDLVSSNTIGYVTFEFIYPSQMNAIFHYGTDPTGALIGSTVWNKTLTLVPFDTPPTGGTPNCAGVPANATCADTALEGHSRVWYDPAQSGQGFTLTAVDGKYWGYYTAYDSEGKAAWWLFNSVGPLNGSNQFSFDLMDYSGPALYSTWDASKVSSRVAGSGTLVMTSATQMSLTIRIGNTVRNLNLVPFDLP